MYIFCADMKMTYLTPLNIEDIILVHTKYIIRYETGPSADTNAKPIKTFHSTST